MGTIKTIALTAAAAAVLTSSSAFAGCGINGNANVSILGNDFPALHAVFLQPKSAQVMVWQWLKTTTKTTKI